MRKHQWIFVTLGMLMWGTIASAQTYTSEFGDGGVITVQSLKRSGSDTVLLKAVIENTGKRDLPIEGVLNVCCGEWSNPFYAALQDPSANKQYEPVTIGRKGVGSMHDKREVLKPQQKLSVWTRITAPPAGVEKITVVFGGTAAPVEDVPIQK